MDLSTGPADQAVPLDLQLLSCANILSCVSSCGDDVACQQVCRDSGNADAKTRFNTFRGCVFATCGAGDGSVPSCSGPTDNGPTCLDCLSTVAHDASITGNACHAEFADCAAN